MYIYPITDPEILKLGIRMALYREKKCTDTNCQDGISVTAFGDYMGKCPHCNDWTKSRIAYIKEPEFKARELVYDKDGRKVRITNINKGIVHYHYTDNPQRYSIPLDIFKQFNSHYYPGQEVESFKYVREMEIKMMDYGSKHTERLEWQEVEEPIMRIDFIIDPKYTKFQEEVNKGEILAEITKQ